MRRTFPRGRPALRRCVAVDPAEFASEFWGRRPLLSPAGTLPRDFGDLLDLQAVDELLSRRGLRTPFLRIAKDGAVLPTSRFTGSGGAGAQVADQVFDDKVLGLFADGSTLVLQGLHRLWPPLIDFADELVADLGHPAQVNAYVTPPQSRGFASHYDVHDVFVLQVAGSKRWVVHEPVDRLPLRSQPWTERRDAVAAAARDREPVLDTVLDAGDALYLPRGYLHAAEALGGVAAHLTVGVHALTRYSVVEALTALVGDVPALRESLPIGFEPDDVDMLRPDLAVTVEALVAALSAVRPEDVAERLRAQLTAASRPPPLPPLAQAAAAADLGDDDRVRLRSTLRPVLRGGGPGDGLVIEVLGRCISLPGADRAAVERLLSGDPCAAGALPGLDPAASLTLVRRLLREAVVVPVAP